ncbi:MAG: M55 family metallopeptidase [Jatrophihabitans sp.]|uniref:M55 family metallopeptidase n=1 Tax=Jatrophihabitans sp. TaxID=1932789 RepID=UPI003910C86F
MRVLVSVDMEGVAGVAAPEDVTPGQPHYDRNCGYMTDEASAAVRGVRAHDPEASVVVVDAHADFRNIVPDRLARGCTLLRGAPRPLSMLTGVDRDVDAVCFIGYHGRAGTAASVLAHTMSGATVARIRCNGEELGELGLNAALAVHYGAVPVLATGDDTLVREASSVVPGMATVEVKRAVGNRAAESLHPDEACARIEAAVQTALQHPSPSNGPPFSGSVDLEMDLLRPRMTEYAAMIPGVELRGPTTVGYQAADFPAAYNLIEVITTLAGSG